jgi:hypothetical protein
MNKHIHACSQVHTYTHHIDELHSETGKRRRDIRDVTSLDLVTDVIKKT